MEFVRSLVKHTSKYVYLRLRMTGFEPATIRLKAEGSTIELHPLFFFLCISLSS